MCVGLGLSQKCAVASLVFIITIVQITNFFWIALFWSLFTLVCDERILSLKLERWLRFFVGKGTKHLHKSQKIQLFFKNWSLVTLNSWFYMWRHIYNHHATNFKWRIAWKYHLICRSLDPIAVTARLISQNFYQKAKI